MRKKTCLSCGEALRVPLAPRRRGPSKFCTKSCKYKHRWKGIKSRRKAALSLLAKESYATRCVDMSAPTLVYAEYGNRRVLVGSSCRKISTGTVVSIRQVCDMLSAA